MAIDNIINYKLQIFIKKDLETVLEYMTLLSHLKPTPTKNEIWDMSLRKVQDCKDNFDEGTLQNLINIIKITEDMNDDEVLQVKVVDFFALINSAKEQIKKIRRAELSSLASNQANFKWEAVGGNEKMSKFGIYNTLDNLSGGDITKWEEILDLPYPDVFTKLYMQTIKGDLEQEMALIKTQ